MLVSVSGLIGSGKDTVADYLVKEHGFEKISFAGTVKDMLAVVFGWDRNMLEGATKESRAWRNEVDQWWANKLGIPHFTPRWAMQNIGTDLWRNYFNNNIWIFAVEKRLSEMKGNVVISDARFPNELAMLKSVGAKLLCIERGEKPDWYGWARKYNVTQDGEVKTRMKIIGSLVEAEPNPINCKIHISEWAWVGTEFDVVIDNDGSIGELYNVVDRELCFSALQGHHE
jgi:hypothetical protein